MSLRAMLWAFDQQVGRSSDKFVLVALAEYVGDTGLAYPSAETLARKTDLNRKTVRVALDRLERRGLIEDTGQRVGSTKQVKVYVVPVTEKGQEGKGEIYDLSALKIPKNGYLKDTQKRVAEPVSTFNHKSVCRTKSELPRFGSDRSEQAQQLSLQTSSQFLEELRADSRFSGLDLEVEWGRFRRWLEKKNLGPPSQRGFLGWLARAEPSLQDDIEDDEEPEPEGPRYYFSWDGWTDEAREAWFALCPWEKDKDREPVRWDKLDATTKAMIREQIEQKKKNAVDKA